MLSNHLILCCPLLLLPSIFPSIRVFSSELAHRIRWPKYWIFSFSISLSNEYSGLTSFSIDWFDLLSVQGTLKSSPAPQFKSINSLAFSFLHSPTLTSIHDHWKKHPFYLSFCLSLTRQTFVRKVMSLLRNTLSRAALVAQLVKNLPAMWETWVRSLGLEDPLEEEMTPQASIFAWEISWTEETGGLQSMGSQRWQFFR